MAKVYDGRTVTIDVDKGVFTAADLAQQASIRTPSARQWIARHAMDLPVPLLVIPLDGMRKMPIWTQEDGRKILDEYKRSMEALAEARRA